MRKRVVQVFKPSDAWRAGPPGIGDFIRGICHLFEVTQSLGMELRIDVSLSELALFLNTSDEDFFCASDPWRLRAAKEYPAPRQALMEIIKFAGSDEENLFISSNIGEWDRSHLPKDTKAFAARFYNFLPAVTVENSWAPSNYAVLNVRCGDDFFGADQKRLPRLQRAFLNNVVDDQVEKTRGSIIVMSDSKRTKVELANRYGFLHTPTSPSHGARGNVLPMLLDVELLKRANHIYHINLWQTWWSGFSHYTSLIFDVPETNVVGPFPHGRRATMKFAIAHIPQILAS